MYRTLYFSRNFTLVFWMTLALLVPLGSAYAACAALYCFKGGVDGAFPLAGLIADKAGNLYGATAGGGGGCKDPGCGTIFELTPNGTSYTEQVLFAFCQTDYPACTQGAAPLAGLVMDKAGNLYGTTSKGGGTGCGGQGCGTVFELVPDGTSSTETVLYSFKGGSGGDGQRPQAGLIIDQSGNLYGTTSGGGIPGCGQFGIGCGTVFKVPAGGGTDKVLHAFSGGPDGETPLAALIIDQVGNLYGTTFSGGANNSEGCIGSCGTAFELAPDGTETALYSFCSQSNCADGANPVGSLILDSNGNLDGTTLYGGTGGCFGYGCGTAFQLAPNLEAENFVSSFTGGNGQTPRAGLIIDKNTGDLYGTTCGACLGGTPGGKNCSKNCNGATYFLGGGGGSIAVKHTFNGKDGEFPTAPLLLRQGNFYGTTENGGPGCNAALGCGVVFGVKK